MGHLIDETTGKAAFVSYLETPWHGLGEIIKEQPKKLLDVLKPAGLNFQVSKGQNAHLFPDGKVIPSEESFFTFREDTGAILGAHVGKGYHVLQNSEALSILEPFFKNEKINFQTAGALRGGNWTFVCCEFNSPIIVGKNDEVKNYFAVFNSFDGTLSVQAYFTPVRVVCNNTLQMSFKQAKQKIAIRHTANMKDRLTEATKILIAAEENGVRFQEMANGLKKTRWSDTKFLNYLTKVFCTPDEITGLQKGKHPFEVLSTRKRNILKDVINFAFDGVGQKEAGEGSAWWGYNAVTGYYSNQKNFSDAEGRAESLYFGGSAKIMEAALAAAQPEAKLPELGLDFSFTDN